MQSEAENMKKILDWITGQFMKGVSPENIELSFKSNPQEVADQIGVPVMTIIKTLESSGVSEKELEHMAEDSLMEAAASCSLSQYT